MKSFLDKISCALRSNPCRVGALLVIAALLPSVASATTVRMETNMGVIDIELYDTEAPKTVRNFLNYAGRGDYSTVAIHRSVPGFVIQGGGFRFLGYVFGQPIVLAVPKDPPIPNEFSPTRSNLRGTIAMAKFPNDPNSATSEWFFNLGDNSANLDNQNGGFTVFGRVLDPGMAVVDAIAALRVFDMSLINPAFTDVPVLDTYDPQLAPQPTDLPTVLNIPNVKAETTLPGALAVLTADVDVTLNQLAVVDVNTMGSLLTAFKPPAGTTVQFNDSIYALSAGGATGSRTMTLYDGAVTRPTHYFAFGPTSDDATPHWYDFSFDGTTGAEILPDRIVLHFVDGERGDDDLAANGAIAHSGSPATVSQLVVSTDTSGGCSIAGAPVRSAGRADWGLIVAFMLVMALLRATRLPLHRPQ